MKNKSELEILKSKILSYHNIKYTKLILSMDKSLSLDDIVHSVYIKYLESSIDDIIIFNPRGHLLHMIDSLKNKATTSSYEIKEECFDKEVVIQPDCENIDLKNAFSVLNDLEKKIIILKFFEGRTHREIASRFKRHHIFVQRIEKKALYKMKLYLEGIK